MDDLISRKKLLRHLSDWQMGEAGGSEAVYTTLGNVMEAVNDMPPAEREKRWIPCEERLPEDERRVLCTVQSGEHYSVVPCIFIQRTRRWLPEVYGNHDNVLAWMPLPEPYKGEEG